MVVDSILNLNEEATFLIGAMNYKSAADLLHEGIAKLEKDYILETDEDGEGPTSDGSTTNQCVMSMDEDSSRQEQEATDRYQYHHHHQQQQRQVQQVVVAAEPSLEYLPPQSRHDADHDHTTSTFSIYRCAMKLVPTEKYLNNADLSCLTHHNFNLVSAVLLYNYGLCLHIQGQASGCETKLEDASLAYEMALSLLGLVGSNNGDDSAAIQHSSSSLLLELALLNNFAHIHLFFLSTKQVHECLRRMHFILFGATQGWAMRIPQELSCFAHNVLFNASQHTRPAPAA